MSPHDIYSRTFADDQEFQELIDIRLDRLSIWIVLMFSSGVSLLIGIILSIIWCYRFKNQNRRTQSNHEQSHIPLGYQDQDHVNITHLTHDEAAHQSVTRNRNNIDQKYDKPEDDTVDTTRNNESIGHEYDEPEDAYDDYV